MVIRRFVTLAVSAWVLSQAASAAAQPTLTSNPTMPNPGVAVTMTVNGPAGQSFAVIGSTTWSGFSYAGVDLSVGTDVQILGVGTLDGAGQGTVSVTPPFPANDRFYVQGVTSPDGFASISPTNRVTLVNNQAARLDIPIGGLVRADGSAVFLSPGLTVSKAGSVYTFSHPGMFEHLNPVPLVTVTGNATVTSIAATFNQTVVTLSNDGGIAITIQAVRR